MVIKTNMTKILINFLKIQELIFKYSHKNLKKIMIIIHMSISYMQWLILEQEYTRFNKFLGLM